MAHKGQHIVNPRTGQEMTFVELTAELLRIESVNPSTSVREPLHVHPHQESGAEVSAGTLIFEVDGHESRLQAGDSIRVPANTPHRFWAEGDEPARSVQFFAPALDSAAFCETFFALAEQDKLDRKGMPSTLQLAVTVREFGEEIRPVTPPWWVLRTLSTVLGPVARWRGLRGRLTMTG